MNKTVCIAGLGLIGSSLALGIRRGQPEIRLIAYNRGAEARNIAVARGIVDEAFADFREAAEQADIIILCVPIQRTLEMLEELKSMKLRERVLVTDAGSTKAEIVAAAENAPFKFVGGHPMAGSHKSGVLAADVNLFENAYYVLTEESAELRELLIGLHAKLIVMAPAEHDAVTSQVSHFPHLLASLLVQQSDDYAVLHPLVRHLAAGGFRDMTRIAESESAMWTAIMLSNLTAVKTRVLDFQRKLSDLTALLERQNPAEISAFFDRGREIRRGMEIHRGAIPNFYDLFVSVPDEKGVVLRVLALLQDISITNVKINENNREDIHGQLQISFKSEAEMQMAKKIIAAATNYEVECE